jgi:cell division protein FtsW (lipid II flippase)
MLKSKRWIAQRWLVAFALGFVMSVLAAMRQQWGQAIVLTALTVLAGVMGGLRWRQSGGA